MCDWVALLYSRKLTEHCKQAIMEKIKINIYVKKEISSLLRLNSTICVYDIWLIHLSIHGYL